MSREWHYKPGDPWFICDRCQKKIRRSRTRKEWTGQIVCRECYDPKHPQLDLKVPHENIDVPEARPRQAIRFVEPGIQEASDLDER